MRRNKISIAAVVGLVLCGSVIAQDMKSPRGNSVPIPAGQLVNGISSGPVFPGRVYPIDGPSPAGSTPNSVWVLDPGANSGWGTKTYLGELGQPGFNPPPGSYVGLPGGILKPIAAPAAGVAPTPAQSPRSQTVPPPEGGVNPYGPTQSGGAVNPKAQTVPPPEGGGINPSGKTVPGAQSGKTQPGLGPSPQSPRSGNTKPGLGPSSGTPPPSGPSGPTGGALGGSPTLAALGGLMNAANLAQIGLAAGQFAVYYTALNTADVSCDGNYSSVPVTIPSSCGRSASCSACFDRAYSNVDRVRGGFAKLRCVSSNFHNIKNAGLALGDSAAGISMFGALAWLPQRQQILEQADKIDQQIDAKCRELLGNLQQSLQQVGECEATEFHNPDWYTRYGFMYFEIMAAGCQR